MNTYDFLLAKQAILINVWFDFKLTQFRLSTFVNFWYDAQIMSAYDFIWAKQVILSNV